MFSSSKLSTGYLIFGGVVVGLYLWLELTGAAFGGSKAPKKIDPNQIRSASPGSWTYIYWAHGSRGK